MGKRLNVGLTAAVIVAAVAWLPVRLLLNMKSEYRTAGVIRELDGHVKSHRGEWPGSAAEFGGQRPEEAGVQIDFSMTSERILEDPRLLREAVRPESRRFYTYPHYERDLERLLGAIRELKGVAEVPVIKTEPE